MNSEDSFDEEFLDDPITLLDVSDSESDHSDYIKSGYKSSSTSFVPITFFDITNNVRLLNDCRPLFIKVVDCDKHPWYYNKIYRKDNTGERNGHENKISNIYINDSDDNSSTDNLIRTVPMEESESDSIESDEQGSDLKTWSLPKNKKIKYSFKRITSTKSILTIKRNKNSKKRKKRKADVDFKKNKGLIGLKITKTMDIIDIDNESSVNSNEIESHYNEHGKEANSKQLDLYIPDVDKALKQVDTVMYPFTQSSAYLHYKDNKTNDKTQSLSLNTNMKSLSPIFPCKLPSNKNMRTNINYTSSGTSLEQPKILTDESFNLSMTNILDDPRVIEAAEKIAMENVITHTQESARSFCDIEKQKESLNPINRNEHNNEIAEISNTTSQIPVIQTSVGSQESFSMIVTKPQSITQHNNQCVVGHQSEPTSHTTISNAKQHQPMLSHNYYSNNLSQNNIPNNRTTFHMCSIYKKSTGENCSLPQFSEKNIPSYLIPNQKYSESNLNYLNYMNVVVGMSRNHAPGGTSNIPQTPYPEFMQRYYNNISPGFSERHQGTDYFRIRPTFSNTIQYPNFNRQDLSRPYMYQPNLPRYPPPRPPLASTRPPLAPTYPPLAATPMVSTPQLQNAPQIIPPQFMREISSGSVGKRTKNPRIPKSVDPRQLQAETDSPKMSNNVHGISQGNSSKVDKHKQNNLKESGFSLSQTVNVAKNKKEMLQELEKEMMNIHGELDGIDDNISKTLPANLKEIGQSRNIDKHCNTTVTRNLYNIRQNNVFDIPFKLQETVIDNRPAQNVNSTIKDNRNFSGHLVPRDDMKNLHKPPGLQDSSLSPLSKKARVAHNYVYDKNYTHMNTHRTINIPKPSKGYSPPILPIPSYDKTLQILTCATFEAKKYLETQKKIEMEKNHAQCNVDKKSVKTTEYFKNFMDKQDKGKKISLEEYKNRKLYEPIMKNVGQKFNVDSNVLYCQNKNFGDASRISELDQGYGSDTVTI